MIRLLLARFRPAAPVPKPITMSFPFARRTVVFLGQRELEEMMLRDVLLSADRSGVSTAGWRTKVEWEPLTLPVGSWDDTLTLTVRLIPPEA